MAGLYTKSQCTYCQEDTTGLRVKCAECVEFELCLQNTGDVGITFGKYGWNAQEELHLLDAVEVYGFGNWEDISRHIETRSSEDAKEQYTSRYLEGVIGRLTWPSALSRRPNLSDAANLDSGPLSPSASGRLPPLDVTPEEAKELNYLPLRDDFDSEYNNVAESWLSSLSVDEDDDLDIALTLAQVDMYAQALRERARRKRVARDYQLVANFFNATTRKDKVVEKKRLTKEEKEFQEGMKVFCQFHTATEHDQFLRNMQREQELKIRLSELARYRRHGITRHEECAHMEQQLLQQQSTGSSGANPTHPAFHPPVSTFLRKRERSDEIVWCSTERKCIFASLGIPLPVKNVVGLGAGETLTTTAALKLLSRKEAALSAALNLKPTEYLALKAALLKIPENSGNDAGVDNGAERGIEMFLTKQGWLPA